MVNYSRENEAAQPRVLMLGPLGSLTGGMATVTANLRDSKLRRTTYLLVMNNGKVTAANRPLRTGLAAQLKLLRGVHRTILHHRINLVHIHSCALFAFWRDTLHMVLARLLRCRVIWHLHDGTFLKFLSQGNFAKRAFIRWALRRGSATIVLSEGSRRQLRPHAPKVDWRVVSNGVPLLPIQPKQENRPPHFLFLGNLTRRKGAYDLIAAVELVAKRQADCILQLAGGEVVAGQQAEIEQRIRESPCSRQIRLPGLVTGSEKERVLAASDGIVLPSYAEGLPMVLLEGMAYGLPVVATRVGSVPEVVDDGVEGFLIEPGDVDSLADCMYRLATDTNLRHRMGRAARWRVEKEFSLDNMADRILSIYNEVLGID